MCAAQSAGSLSDIELIRLLGYGGYGHVMYGKWQGIPAAIKVHARVCESVCVCFVCLCVRWHVGWTSRLP